MRLLPRTQLVTGLATGIRIVLLLATALSIFDADIVSAPTAQHERRHLLSQSAAAYVPAFVSAKSRRTEHSFTSFDYLQFTPDHCHWLQSEYLLTAEGAIGYRFNLLSGLLYTQTTSSLL